MVVGVIGDVTAVSGDLPRHPGIGLGEYAGQGEGGGDTTGLQSRQDGGDPGVVRSAIEGQRHLGLLGQQAAPLGAPGLMSGDSSPTWNTIDLVTDVLLVAGLAGFTASGAARGWLARIGLSLAFAGLVLYALAAVLGFGNAQAGETLHPVSVPITGIGMLLTGVATIRTRHWNSWRRLAPPLCGIVPFTVELPGSSPSATQRHCTTSSRAPGRHG